MATSIKKSSPKKGDKTFLTQVWPWPSLALGVLLHIHPQFPVSLSFTIFVHQACVSFPVEFSPPAAFQRCSLKENICRSSSCVFIFKFSAVAATAAIFGYKTSQWVVSTVSWCCEKVRQTRNLLKTWPLFHSPCRQGFVPSVWKSLMILVTISLCFQSGFSFQSSSILGSAFYY